MSQSSYCGHRNQDVLGNDGLTMLISVIGTLY